MEIAQAQVEWISVREAAQRMNRSERRVQDLTGDGSPDRPFRCRRDPDSRNNALQVNAADVEAYLEERRMAGRGRRPATNVVSVAPTAHAAPAVARAANGAVAKHAPEMAALVAAMVETLRPNAANAANAGLAPGACLTLAEAAAYKRLSPRLLRSYYHRGLLRAHLDEPVRAEGRKRAEPGSSLRFERAALDALDGELYAAEERAAGA